MANEEEPKMTPEQEKMLQDEITKFKEAVEKQDTPLAHGALGELLFSTCRDEYMKESIHHLEIASQGGINKATAYLGDAYYNGKGVEKDIKKAMDYFMDAALDGNVDAVCSLGTAYFLGKEVEPDYAKAKDFLEEAVSMGSSKATNTLGLMYLGGFGCDQNIIKAKRLFNRAMEKGNVNAKQNLEMIKRQGRRFDYHDFILASFEKDETAELPGQ